jgi:hypothetical protein
MKQILLIILLAVLCSTTKAQLSTGEIPYSLAAKGSDMQLSKIPKVTLSNLDMKAIEEEDSKNERSDVVRPLRFGFLHDVKLSLSNSGTWTTTSDGGRLWNLKIYSPDAISLNLLYDKFWLPEGGKFFIYSEDAKQYIGAFTSENNKIDEKGNNLGFATGFLFTNCIVLEYYEPKETKESGIISICQVVSGYRYVYDLVNQSKHNITDLNCHNDINCPEGNGFASEKDAVAHILMGNHICTGALLNTTAGDNRPVFLSANHCFEGTTANVSQWVFFWNYEAPCGGVVNRDNNRSTTGAYLLARNANSDFLLLSLYENPAMNSNISLYYLGWDRTTSQATSAVCIHHPKGAQKKISLTTNVTPNGNFWFVDFSNGSTEGGSSGSPLLNQNRRVVGQLWGGITACVPNAKKDYGRLDVSWNGNSSSQRLRDWLDPLGANPTFINGTGCNINLNNRTYNSTDLYTNVTGMNRIGGCDVEISNTIVNSGTIMRLHGRNNIVLKPGFRAVTGSNVRITAGTGIFPMSRGVNEEAFPSILLENNESEPLAIDGFDLSVFPSPNNGNFSVKITGEIQPYTIEILDIFGVIFGSFKGSEENFNINLNLRSGIYFAKVTMANNVVVKKFIVN